MSRDSTSPLEQARLLLEEHIASGGDAANFESLCAEHPGHASDLRRLLKQPATDQNASLFHPQRTPVPTTSGPCTLVYINNLGVLLKDQGKLAEAEPPLREALEGFCRTLGDEHPNTLKSMNYLGLLLQAQGKYDEAQALYHEALEGSRRQLGDDHPSTLKVKQSLDTLLKEKQASESPPPAPPSDGKDGDHP